MKFSLSTLPFIDNEIDMRLFETLRNNGIESIELFAQKPHCDLMSDKHILICKKIEDDLGMRINSIHLPIYFNRTADVNDRRKIEICSSDNNTRTRSVREIISQIEMAQSLGIPIAVLHTGLTGSYEGEIEYLLESLYLIDETAKKGNLLIALENHTTEFVTIDVLISLIQKVDSNNLGICLDVGHSNIFSNYIGDLNKARRYLFSLHLHDNNGDEDEHLFPYEGGIDFDYIIGFLRRSRFEGVVTLELNGEKISSEEEFVEFVKKASVYIRGFQNPRLTYSNLLEPT